MMSQGSSVSIVTRLRAGRRVTFPRGQGMDMFLFATAGAHDLWTASNGK